MYGAVLTRLLLRLLLCIFDVSENVVDSIHHFPPRMDAKQMLQLKNEVLFSLPSSILISPSTFSLFPPYSPNSIFNYVRVVQLSQLHLNLSTLFLIMATFS